MPGTSNRENTVFAVGEKGLLHMKIKKRINYFLFFPLNFGRFGAFREAGLICCGDCGINSHCCHCMFTLKAIGFMSMMKGSYSELYPASRTTTTELEPQRKRYFHRVQGRAVQVNFSKH